MKYVDRNFENGDYKIIKLPRTKKLRDLTIVDFRKWANKNCKCDGILCKDCPFYRVGCCEGDDNFWLDCKEIYSDKFLDQEIEIPR